MGKRIDLLGQKFGCLTVTNKFKSLVGASGYTVGRWEVRCDCGLLSVKRAQTLRTKKHKICGTDCSFKSTALVSVNCETCKSEYKIKRSSLSKKSTRSCQKCRALSASMKMKGRPAHNRLPDGEGSFNLLYSSYKQSAKNRGISFSLSVDEFKVLTKGNCHFCGSEPATKAPVSRKAIKATPYIYNGIDRIDNTKGYEAGNMVSCCGYCNKMKGPLQLDKFFSLVSNIYKRHLSPA